jgi:hypothetical protein
MTILLISLIVFGAVFTQSLTGFGLALVSMPLLAALLGLQTAAPLVALIGVAAEGVLLVRYRLSVNRKMVLRLLLPSLFGIPLGVLALREIGEAIMLTILGVFILVYAVYALWNPGIPSPKGAGWAYGAGFLAGLLGGAYNTAGPPVIVYGDSQRWMRSEFKGNLQGFFLFNSIFLVLTHWFAQNYTSAIWRDFLLALPALALGVLGGLWLDGRMDADKFRKLVLLLLIVIGIALILPRW